MNRSHFVATTARIAVTLLAGAVLAALPGCGGAPASRSRDGVSVEQTRTQEATSAPKSPTPSAPVTISLQPPSYEGYEPLPCFMYHHVDPTMKDDLAVTPAQFESHLKALQAAGYRTITARELAEYHAGETSLPPRPAMITFDDGWKNQFKYAVPLLKKYGFTATFFVNPKWIGKGGAYMTAEQVASLADTGFDVESHTWGHVSLVRSHATTQGAFGRSMRQQFRLAEDWIRDTTGQKPVALCYPFGFYDSEVVAELGRAGYDSAYTTEEGVADARPWDALVMKRFNISRGVSAAGFAKRLSTKPLPALELTPAPGSRVRGKNVNVSADITEVPAGVKHITLFSGNAMGKTTVVVRDGRRYATGTIKNGRAGFRQITLQGEDGSGTQYVASWSIVLGD